jgi:hypothetical protein
MRCRVPAESDETLTPHTPSLRAQRSNPESLCGKILDCFAALAMTWKEIRPNKKGAVSKHDALICCSARDQLVCWIADNSQALPERRAKVQTSVTSLGCSLPATIAPVLRSTVLSVSEKRIATVA